MQVVSCRRRTALIVLLVILVGLQFPYWPPDVRAASSVSGTWEQMPPYGGTIVALAIDPSDSARVYAGTIGGLFRSADHGLTWAAVTEGLPFAWFGSVAFDPVTPSKLYAGTLANGLFLSTDSGGTWAQASSGLTDGARVTCLSIDPLHTSTLYAGTDDGIFRSTDAGVHWTSPSSTLVGVKILCLAIDPVTPSTLFAGSDRGLFESSDGGTTWTKFSIGLTNSAVSALAIDPLTPSRLYAGTDAGVFTSVNQGSTWTATSSGLTGKNITCLAVDPIISSTLYAGTISGGVVRSMDGGGNWTRFSNTLSEASILALALDPTAPSVLYAGAYMFGLSKSIDHAATWRWSEEGLYVPYIKVLATNPALPLILLVGTQMGLYMRQGDGATWTVASVPFVEDLVFDPVTPSTVYAASSRYGLYRSTDRSSGWTRVSDKLFKHLAIDPVTPSSLFAATDAELFASVNSGSTWTAASSGLTGKNITCLAIDPITGSTLCTSTDAGLFRSTDHGRSLEAVSPELASATVVIDPKTPTTVYAAGSLGVYRSIDGGGTWKLCSNSGMIVKPTAIAVDPVTPSTVYAGSAGGLFCSTDAGDTWTAMSRTGLPPSTVNSIAVVSGRPTTLFACTDRGLFRWVPMAPPSVPDSFIILTSQIEVTLTWSASTAGSSPLGGYAVYRSTTRGNTGDMPIANVGAAFTSWTDRTCQQGVTYYYSVAAFDSQATPLSSAKSSEVSAKLLPLPPEPVVVTLTLRMGSTTMLVSGSDGTSDTVTLDAAPVLGAGNRTLVPVRAVAEAMGGTVSWDPVSRKASVTVGSNTLELTLGNNVALFNGTVTPIDADPRVVPLIINGRAMLPLRFVVESPGAEVSYDQATKTITITYTKT